MGNGVITLESERWSSFLDPAAAARSSSPPAPAGVARRSRPGRGGNPLGLSLSHKCTVEHPGITGDDSLLSDIEPGEFVAEIAHGGTYFKIRQLSKEERPPVTDRKRGHVMGFSRASRVNMLGLVNSIDRSKVKGGTIFVTLTMRHDVKRRASEADWKKIERHRRAWMERLRRKYSDRRYFVLWKKEPHESGHVHLHMLIFFLDALPHLVDDFRPWNDRAWAEVVDPKNPDYDAPACRTEFMRSWNGVGLYTAKYCAKIQCHGSIRTGRVWGVERRDMLEAAQTLEKIGCSERVGVRVRRVLRKLQEKRRTCWLYRCASGFWSRVVPGKLQVDDVEFAGPAEHMSVSEKVAAYRSLEISVKYKKGRATRRRTREIWGYSIDDECVIPVGIEHENYTTSTHFLDTGQAMRLLTLFMLQDAGEDDAAPF